MAERSGRYMQPSKQRARLAAEPDRLPARPLKSLLTSVAAESVLCSFSLQSVLVEKSFEPAAPEGFAQSAKFNIRPPWAESPFRRAVTGSQTEVVVRLVFGTVGELDF
jgi:hypothetical protein